MTEIKGTIFDIQRFSVSDGPGIRTTVFFKGCNLRCAWCHNPESQSAYPEMMFYKNRCINCGKCKQMCSNHDKNCIFCGECVSVCPAEAREIAGKEYTTDSVIKELLKDKGFYESSGGGVTFSGGECMLQIDFLKEILSLCKKRGLHTAVDTAGCVPYEFFERILPYTDLFLYDLKCIDSEKHKKYTEASNELIIQNFARLLKDGKRVWVRIPVIPEVNGTVEEMKRIKTLLDDFGTPEKVELLPYHDIGNSKYEASGRAAMTFSQPSEDKMNTLRAIFET